MQRSRYPSQYPSDFTRRDGFSERREENKTVELFVKFRTFRPYLKKRLTTIHKDGRERELRDEVEDIKYYLSVMSDMLADENHGAAALQGFIDRIHEMIRKNPLNDSLMSNPDSPENSDIEEVDANGHSCPPRSPSPTEILDTLSDVPATARTIPLEREPKEFSYFQSLEETIDKQMYEKKKKSGSRSQWDADDSFNQRSSHRDVDMRDRPHVINTVPLGRGSGLGHSTQWEQPESNGNRGGFGRGAPRDENHFDWDERYNRGANNNYFGPGEGNFPNNRNVDESWRDIGSWNSFGRGRGVNPNNVEFDRPVGRDSRDYVGRQNQERRDSYSSRDYNRDGNRGRQYERNSSYPPSEQSYDSSRGPPQDNALFDRRPPQFERRRNTSNNPGDIDGSVQIDYNHGGDDWENSIDRDMRGMGSNVQHPPPVANLFSSPNMNIFEAQQQQQQQMFLNTQQNLNYGMNQNPVSFMPNQQPLLQGLNAANIIGLNMGIPNLQSPVGVPNNMGMQNNNNNLQNNRVIGNARFGQTNNRPGLLPTPPVVSPHQAFSFRNPTSQPSSRASQPQSVDNFLPDNNDVRQQNSGSQSSALLKEIRQKAQQCFSRVSTPKKDNQNVPPTTNSAATGMHSTVAPPPRTSNESLLASNQMLSDRDPRLNRLQKKPNSVNPPASQSDSHHSQSASKPTENNSTTGDTRRVQIEDPRLASSRSREDNNRRRNVSGEVRSSSKTRDECRDSHNSIENRRTDDSRDSRHSRVGSDHQPTNKHSSSRVGNDQSTSKHSSSRVGSDQHTSSSKRLDDTRNRVKANMPPPVKPNNPSKLQELRKQAETEFHLLGRPIPKKKTSSFDDAIIVPVETHHTRPPAKSPSKSNSSRETRDPSKERGLENAPIPQKKSQKEKPQEPLPKKGTQSKAKTKEKAPAKVKKISKKRQKEIDKELNSTQPPVEVVKKPVYRIPKLKKPEPVVVPPPEPSPVEDDTSSDLHIDENHDGNNANEGQTTSANGSLTSETEKLIEQFIRSSVDPAEADNILNDPQAISVVFQRLKQQVQQMCPTVPHSASGAQVADLNVTPPEPLDEVHESEVIPDEDLPKDQGPDRSRSTIRKKSTKRRSSLEKLHDALKEMRFDTMLPLGPRRCTRGAADDSQDAGSSSQQSNPSTQVEIPSEVAQGTPTAHSSNQKEGSTEKASPAAGSKRGRKRKRKASKLKPNKKKKGPVTRAQAAVKTALKLQKKEKERAEKVLLAGPEALKKKQPKVVNPDTALQEARVTRSSVHGRTAIFTNVALEKIKIEADYIPLPKSEPEDHNIGDCITAGTGFEHLEDPAEPTTTTTLPTVVEDIPNSNRIEMPSFDFDEEIKKEVEEYNISDSEMEIDHIDTSVVEDKVVNITQDEELDVDYRSDFSMFPEIVVDGSYSVQSSSNNEVLLNLLSKVKVESEDNLPDAEQMRGSKNNDDIMEKCNDLLDWMVSTVEYKTDEGVKEGLNCNLSTLNTTIAAESDKEILPAMNISIEPAPVTPASDDDEEPSDYYCTKIEEDYGSNYSSDDESCSNTTTDTVNANILELDPSNNTRLIADEDDRMESTNDEANDNCLNTNEGVSSTNGTSRELENGGRVTNLKGHELYKCANKPCRFTAATSVIFKEHITTCTFATESGQVGCYHCDKRVKAISNLLEHLKVHGQKQQICALCPFKTWVNSELTRHMKTAHKVYSYKVERVEFEDDEDPDFVVYPKEVASKVITLKELRESYSQYADRLLFGPDDIDKIPSRHIFNALAYCALCSYSSKIRINILRHLNQHKEAIENPETTIPVSDPVNPVPCLERKELMFDKMTNWAGSTHAHKPGPASNDNSALPQFVSEQFRYVCSVPSCHQITTDEFMLRTHIKTLHEEVTEYKCPHCDKNEQTRNDPRNTVSIDKLGFHLKLHGPKLYRCAYCDVIHTQVTPMEKHLPERHPEKKPIHYLIRNMDANGVVPERTTANWRCAICSSKNLFSTYAEVKNHCRSMHQVFGQFSCAYCKFYTDSSHTIKSHILSNCHNKKTAQGKIMILWYRNEFNPQADDNVHCPIWKRQPASVKHIRGIFLEDVKEKNSKAESTKQAAAASTNVAATPAAAESDSNSNNTTPSTASPKKSLPKATVNNVNITEGKATKPLVAENQIPKVSVLMICPKCNIYKTKNRTDMKIHLFNELHYQRYGCTKCDLKFVTESSLKGHYTGDHGMTYNKNACNLQPCNSAIETFVSDYFTHQDLLQTKIKEDNQQSEEKKLRCKHCNLEFFFGETLKAHVIEVHMKPHKFRCGYCKYTDDTELNIRQHHLLRHSKIVSVSCKKNKAKAPEHSDLFWEINYGIIQKEPLSVDPLEKGDFEMEDSFINPPVPVYNCPQCLFDTTEYSEFAIHAETCVKTESDLLFDLPDDLANNPIKEEVMFDPSELSFVDDFLGDESVPTAKGSPRKENANVYKCFHCKDNFFTVRGARSHWKRAHSSKPEERCNYYEYKAFNESMELPPWMELCCSHCDYKVSSMILMKNHHQSAHENQVFRMKRKTRIGNHVYVCSYCMHECSQIAQLEEHHNQVHPDELITYSVMDIQTKENSDVSECFGKLIEDTVKYLCSFCEKEFESLIECKDHMNITHLETSTKDPTLKYSRHVINSRIKVPADNSEVLDNTQDIFVCPMCDYKTEDRQKLVSDHLTEHIRSYVCPICEGLFQTHVDTKFHIRHFHSDPIATPLVNRGMYQAREMLENAIELLSAVNSRDHL